MSSSVENSDMVNNDAAASGQQTAVSNPSDNPKGPVTAHQAQVYGTGLFSDMTIICGDQTFKTHRIVFCSKSKVFTAMVAGNFKEAQEPVVVNFPEDDPEVMECVIEYLYRDSYQETLEQYINNHGAQFEARLHVQVFATAEKYNIEGLQTISGCAFELSLDNLHDSDDKHQKLAAYRRALHAVRSVYDTIHPTYGSEFRDMLLFCLFHERFDLRAIEASNQDAKELREEVMRETPEFAIDVANNAIGALPIICEACAIETSGFPLFLMRAPCSICNKDKLYRMNSS